MLATLPFEATVSLGSRLDEALELAWMALQPICRGSDGSVVGHEALLRTRSSALRGPLEILEAARRLDRMEDVGRRTRRLSAALLQPGADLYVNLWPSDLLDPDLGSDECALRPIADRVVLEITEHLPIEAVPGLTSRLQRLRALGFRIALDDFGAGHAGLSSWARLEPEILKVDRRITSGLPECRAMRRILEGAVELASHSASIVVAEGIETVPQLEACVAAGCHLVQGYLLGMPAPMPAQTAAVAWRH